MGMQQSHVQTSTLPYQEIVASARFQELVTMKKRFTIAVTLFFMSFALLLPILAFYTNWLRIAAIGPITWGWLYAFAQFVMTFTICHLYVKKAALFDDMAERVLTDVGRGR
ncbi:hypothetical protein A374_16153 [Fictibacillus macauensis ZFHKF-1]|uniref:DUF485 domain-containing protein n=1 Tax=Fictibacillus macauensis ZFHKF-1 TaxID=1196324 RepID=I8UBM0_9BACL|nr:DUF485 domain-containing protein [Fictibacillus macauensis]EIT84335.1 hypothetical protein A374_16153 [Fictibacillus macauensis ZFHKF-1]